MSCLRCHHNIDGHAGSDGCLFCDCTLSRGGALSVNEKTPAISIPSGASKGDASC